MNFSLKTCLAAAAIVMATSTHAQMTFKKTEKTADKPAAEATPKAVVPAPKPAVRPTTPASAAPARARPAPEATPKAVAAAQAATPSPVAVLRRSTEELRKKIEGAKTNAEVAKLVADADINIDLKVPDAAVLEPVTVYFVEPQSLFGGLFGSIKARTGAGQEDPSVMRTKDGRKVLDSVKMAGQLRLPGVSEDMIEATMEYAQSRGEVVDLEAWVQTETEAMILQNKFSTNSIVRTIKVLSGQRGRFVFLLPAESNVREMKQITVASAQPTQPGQAAPAAAPAAVGNGSDLCPAETNFFSRGICETKTCKERADLAGHPTCVKIREAEQANMQQQNM